MDKPTTFEDMTALMTSRFLDRLKNGTSLDLIISDLVMRSAEWGADNQNRHDASLQAEADAGNKFGVLQRVVRHDRERAAFRMALRLLGADSDTANASSAKLADAMHQFPDGTLVLTHGPFKEPSMAPKTSADSVVAMWWQDDDDGSQFNELLWTRP